MRHTKILLRIAITNLRLVRFSFPPGNGELSIVVRPPKGGLETIIFLSCSELLSTVLLTKRIAGIGDPLV